MLLLMASGAFAASPVHLCVGQEAGSPVRSGGTTGECKAKETPVALPSEKAEQETLLSILPHIKYEASGVAGKPTIQVSGVNVQVVNGGGKTATTHGEGNLVIGYDENGPWPKHTQTGSHNLILVHSRNSRATGAYSPGLKTRSQLRLRRSPAAGKTTLPAKPTRSAVGALIVPVPVTPRSAEGR